MTAVERQGSLLLPAPRIEVSLDVIRKQPSRTAAFRLAQEISGKQDKAIAADLEIDPGQWSRIKSGQAHFPLDKEIQFYDLVGNEVPLIWLADRRGYDLVRRESDLERENRSLREQLAREQAEREAIVRFLKEAKF